MMNQIIAQLLPSIISLKVYDKIYGEDKVITKRLERYLKSLLIVNLISYIIMVYIFKKTEFTFTNIFTIKYSILGILISFIYPILEKIISSNINIKIKVEENEEKD